jgi:hypothetical protein
VLFICQDEAQRDDFLARADGELTGHRWHPSRPPDQHEYIGRRWILFCHERDAHLGDCTARRLAPYPPGHPARHGHGAQMRSVRLPGGLMVDQSRRLPKTVDRPQGAPFSGGAAHRLTGGLDSGRRGAERQVPEMLSTEAIVKNPNSVQARGAIGAGPKVCRWLEKDAEP